MTTAKAWFSAAAALLALGIASTAWAGDLEVNRRAGLSGTYGLELATGVDCSVDDVAISGGAISGDTIACKTITADDTRVDVPGASFRAGEAIALEDGFAVPAGTTFEGVVSQLVATPYAWVEDPSPPDVSTYRAAFLVDLHDFDLDGEVVGLLEGFSRRGDVWFQLALEHRLARGEVRPVLLAWEDDGSYLKTPYGGQPELPVGVTELEIRWRAGNGDGELQLLVDGVAAGGLSGLDNDSAEVGLIKLGALAGTVEVTTGSFYLDAFRSTW